MPKTIRNAFYKKLTFVNLVNAHYRAVEGKRSKLEPLLFEQDLETNISNILYKLQNDTYRLGKYKEFKIYEPKERTIKSLPYKDRVVHQWYVYEFIKPYYMKRFIKDTYACIDGRGTHSCSRKTQVYMKRMQKKYKNYYIIKCDVKKYFYSIDKDILYRILSKVIKDKPLLKLTKILIYDNDEKKGIPIGNYTSQYYANIYLNELDHYIKDKLKVKYYLRYMDDFVILLPTKEECRTILNKIKVFLKENLDLELNHKTRIYPNKFGCNFCGYVIHENYMLLRKRCLKKIKRKLREGNLVLNNYHGHLMHANSYNFCKKMEENILLCQNKEQKET